jgi:hypothetical protein
MIAYILGAGASAHAAYPLASRLLHALSDWLDQKDESEHWVAGCRNRIVQVRETFGSLDDFEGILAKLEEYGDKRVRMSCPTTYRQDLKDIFHDCTERMRSDVEGADTPATGFYPQYLRSDLISAFREYFYEIETARSGEIAYDRFARKIDAESLVITLNYDVALERALAKAGKWDIGTGYGFKALPERAASPTTVYKLHGSVNWFQAPMQQSPPPLMFSRDLKLLGYDDFADPRVGRNNIGINNSGTFVLPDPKKQFFWERFWRPLWGAAARRLKAASEVFIHGYSMPPPTRRHATLSSGTSARTRRSTFSAGARANGSPRNFAAMVLGGLVRSPKSDSRRGQAERRACRKIIDVHLAYHARASPRTNLAGRVGISDRWRVVSGALSK